MVKEGIIDPTKVVRSALQNAASVATLLLTSDALVADDAEGREEEAAAAAAATTTCIEIGRLEIVDWRLENTGPESHKGLRARSCSRLGSARVALAGSLVIEVTRPGRSA